MTSHHTAVLVLFAVAACGGGGGTEVEVLLETMTMELPGVPASLTSSALAGPSGMSMQLDNENSIALLPDK